MNHGIDVLIPMNGKGKVHVDFRITAIEMERTEYLWRLWKGRRYCILKWLHYFKWYQCKLYEPSSVVTCRLCRYRLKREGWL
jgi:hypothetical protein